MKADFRNKKTFLIHTLKIKTKLNRTFYKVNKKLKVNSEKDHNREEKQRESIKLERENRPKGELDFVIQN